MDKNGMTAAAMRPHVGRGPLRLRWSMALAVTAIHLHAGQVLAVQSPREAAAQGLHVSRGLQEPTNARALDPEGIDSFHRAVRATAEPEKVFDGKPSVLLQNFDLDSMENPDGDFVDLTGRPYRGQQPGSFEHPGTGPLKSLGIALLTPVLTPIVSPAAYFARKFGPNRTSKDGEPPAPAAASASTGSGKLQKGLFRVLNFGFKLLTGLVFVPFAAVAYSLLIATPQRLAKTATRTYRALAD